VKRILLDSFRLLLISMLVSFYFIPTAAAEQDNSFSFVVFGDNRLPGYLPYTSDQIDEAEEWLEQMKLYGYGPDLVLDKEISFDPDTGKLDWLKFWPRGAPEKYRLVFLKNGWPRLIVLGPQADVALRSDPLPLKENPHPYLKPFASELKITVFNGHIHTTEVYQVDGIRYLLLGAGGGEQGYQANIPPKDYPEELYWKGQPRVEDYNYLRVQVSNKGTRMWLRRFRPGADTPVEEVELYQE